MGGESSPSSHPVPLIPHPIVSVTLPAPASLLFPSFCKPPTLPPACPAQPLLPSQPNPNNLLGDAYTTSPLRVDSRKREKNGVAGRWGNAKVACQVGRQSGKEVLCVCAGR